MSINSLSNSDGAPLSPLAQFNYPREVRFVDTDATGFAHFSSYFRMMEEAEYAFLRSRGLCVVLKDERGTMGFPRISCEIDIVRPLSLGEQVDVSVSLVRTDGKRVVYQFKIIDDSGEVAVTGQFLAALCRFPDGKLPYAILFPPGLTEKLTAPM